MKFNTSTNSAEDLYNLVQGLSRAEQITARRVIGDSVNNHRTLSVNQLLRTFERFHYNKTATGIRRVYNYLLSKDYFQTNRSETFRTDAYDISEFASVLRQACVNPSIKGHITKLLVND